MISPRQAAAGIAITAALLVATVQREGYTDHPVIPVPGDVPTEGFGRTTGEMYPKTEPVRELVFMLDALENNYAKAVRRCVSAPLYQREFDALVSLAYNAGGGAVCREIAPRFNAAADEADYAAACEAMRTWRATVRGRDCRDRRNNCRGLVTDRARDANKCLGLA